MKVLGRGSIASWLEVALNVLVVVLWIALGAVVIAAVGYAVVMGLVAAGVLSSSIFAGGHGHISNGSADITYNFDEGFSWQIVGPAFAAAAVAVSGGLIIVNRLKRLFASFRSGDPFRKENATHLRVIWMSMMVIELSRYGLLALTGVLIAAFGEPSGTDMNFKLHVSLMSWVAILVLIVLAEVFREGTRLREEQDLTI